MSRIHMQHGSTAIYSPVSGDKSTVGLPLCGIDPTFAETLTTCDRADVTCKRCLAALPIKSLLSAGDWHPGCGGRLAEYSDWNAVILWCMVCGVIVRQEHRFHRSALDGISEALGPPSELAS